MMAKGIKSIKVNALLNSVRTVLNLIFPLITFPYVSRILLVDELGKYNFSQSIVSYFLLIAALGIDNYAIREGAKYRDDRKKISTFASQVFTINIVSTIVSYVFLAIYICFSAKAKYYLACILIFSLQIFFTTLGTEWIYSIFEEYTYITVRSIVFKVISIILLFALVRKPGDYLNYAAVTVFASVGSNILNFVNVRKFCDLRLTFNFKWKNMLRPIMIIFASNVAIQIYVNSDTTMLGYMDNDYVVGIYSLSVKIYTIIKSVLLAALRVAVPRLSLYAGKNQKDEYDSLLLKLTNALLILVVPAIVGMIMLSKNIVLIVGGNNYESSQSSLIILSVAIIFSIFSTLFNTCVLIPFKREKYSLRSSVASACENIGLNFFLIPLLAENGAAVTTVFAELTMAFMNYYSCKDIVKKTFMNKSNFHNIISIVIGSGSIIVTCYFVCTYFKGLIIQTIISVFASAFVYAALLLVLRNPVALNFWDEFKRKAHIR